MAVFRYEFEWDPVKAAANFSKHGLDFERATEVFRDPLTLTIADEGHSGTDTRWITLGPDTSGQYVLVVHTFGRVSQDLARVRLISARRPTKAELPSLRGGTMKAEYDFSKGERGKFFRPNAELRLPVYLDADVQSFLAERAARKGVQLNEMVNGILKDEIRIIESVT